MLDVDLDINFLDCGCTLAIFFCGVVASEEDEGSDVVVVVVIIAWCWVTCMAKVDDGVPGMGG